MGNLQKKNAFNEIEILQKLSHPFITKYRESFIDGLNLCIVMDYASKGDFYSLISERKNQRKGLFP